MQILDHDAHRARLRKSGEEPVHCVEELDERIARVGRARRRVPGVGAAELGHQQPEVGQISRRRLDVIGRIHATHHPQRLDEGYVRKRTVRGVEAAADDHDGSLLIDNVRQLGDHAGLADAGVTPEQHRRHLRVGAGCQRDEPVELVLSADQADRRRRAHSVSIADEQSGWFRDDVVEPRDRGRGDSGVPDEGPPGRLADRPDESDSLCGGAVVSVAGLGELVLGDRVDVHVAPFLLLRYVPRR